MHADISTKECEIIYSRILCKGRPANILIGHIEVEHANAQDFSPKSMRELKALGADFGVNVLVPSGVKGTRWLPHVFKALETFLRPGKDDHGQFTAVYCHMDHLAGSSANADIAGQARKAVCGLEHLLVTTELMAARPKPGGRLSQLQAALRQQKRQQDEQAEMPIYKFQKMRLFARVPLNFREQWRQQ
ncbi:hypothetical protein SKAU_G00354050 [Synaphobranchus kaupii]|uniref:Uncharacterized protein n=1 Tax=Synaphobranchus kaupii TaxID=118154 RepID=A0A9Q1EH17_SYNKA|nr:hypothetical protein SKAU_G00354050 [Synaphobranchus kaupii]